MLQPKVKKSKNPFSLSPSSIHRRIASIGVDPYPIVREDTTDAIVTRYFMSAVYGGSPVDTFPPIKKELLAKHGLNDFMYPSLEMNPEAPQLPGAPGLFYEGGFGRPADEWPRIQRVIVRLGRSLWFYVGSYKLAPTDSLTRLEWANQDPKVGVINLFDRRPLFVLKLLISVSFGVSGKTTFLRNIRQRELA